MNVVVAYMALALTTAETNVAVIKSPNSGIQPQAVVDQQKTLHLIFFKGEPGHGDLFYVKRKAGAEYFSEPIRVNNTLGSAVATGTIRGGQIALGKNGRVHVAWNGSNQVNGPNGHPMLYARLNDAGTAFEEQRNLMQKTMTLDGGGTVAADDHGNVFVAWHGLVIGGDRGEDKRQVWIARSSDEGKTFTVESPAWTEPTGVCGCCSMKAFCDSNGTINMLYRSATSSVNRDLYLLSSTDHGQSFRGSLIDHWRVQTCPMSTMAFAEGPQGVIAAWETNGQIYFGTIKPATREIENPRSAPGSSRGRKHPALAVNAKGEMIVVWTEGTGWQKGGDLCWQVFDKTGMPTNEKGQVFGGIPVWGLATAVTDDKGFTIIH